MRLIFLFIFNLIISMSDSLNLKSLSKFMNTKKNDTLNLKVDLYKKNNNFSLFIPKNPDKGRISDFDISADEIAKIKEKSSKYNTSPLRDDELVILETSKGTIKIKLYNDIAPNHCLNFKKLCNSGFYDLTSFHRVVKNFMIQGGDILSRDKNRDNDGTGSPGWSIENEFNKIRHKRGIVSMARSSDINSAGSQFFICTKDSFFLDGKYTVFGEVVEGMEVVDAISTVPTDRDLRLQTSNFEISDNEDMDNWIKVSDYELKRDLFFKIPLGENSSSFRNQVVKELRSKNPFRRIEIKKARVYVQK